jgi:hypothetical protein
MMKMGDCCVQQQIVGAIAAVESAAEASSSCRASGAGSSMVFVLLHAY